MKNTTENRKHDRGQRDRILALVTQRARETRQALTLACDMMTWPSAVHTLWTGLAAAVTVEPRRTDCSVARGERKAVDRVRYKNYIE